MKRQQVQSSNLQSVGYATDSKELHVEFKGGKVFKYLDVPDSDYQDMMNCNSVGSYFSRIIRKNYQAEEVIEEPVKTEKCDHSWKAPDLSTCEKCGDKDWM